MLTVPLAKSRVQTHKQFVQHAMPESMKTRWDPRSVSSVPMVITPAVPVPPHASRAHQASLHPAMGLAVAAHATQDKYLQQVDNLFAPIARQDILGVQVV